MGTVREIFTTTAAGEPMIRQQAALAVPGQGLAGDRYALATGFYSGSPMTAGARELTLIDLGAIEEVTATTGLAFSTSESRRNLVTSGIDLAALIGYRFRVGEAICEGVRACPPCVHLESLTGKQVMGALAYSGGLRARIVEGGTIREGDSIETIGPAAGPSVGSDD